MMRAGIFTTTLDLTSVLAFMNTYIRTHGDTIPNGESNAREVHLPSHTTLGDLHMEYSERFSLPEVKLCSEKRFEQLFREHFQNRKRGIFVSIPKENRWGPDQFL